MNKLIYLFLLVGGVIAVVYGIVASQSLSSSFARFFTGTPTDNTVWLLSGGAIAVACGIVGLVRETRFP
jgi:hypothetical protein